MRVGKIIGAAAQIILAVSGLSGEGAALAQVAPPTKQRVLRKTAATAKAKTREDLNEQPLSISLSELKRDIEDQAGFHDLTMAEEVTEARASDCALQDNDNDLLRTFNENARAMGLKTLPVIFIYSKEGNGFETKALPNAYALEMEGSPAAIGFSSSLIPFMFPDIPDNEKSIFNFSIAPLPGFFDTPNFDFSLTDPQPTALDPPACPEEMFPHIPAEQWSDVFRILAALDAHENAHIRLKHVAQFEKAHKKELLEFNHAIEKRRRALQKLTARKQSKLEKGDDKKQREIKISIKSRQVSKRHSQEHLQKFLITILKSWPGLRRLRIFWVRAQQTTPPDSNSHSIYSTELPPPPRDKL